MILLFIFICLSCFFHYQNFSKLFIFKDNLILNNKSEYVLNISYSILNLRYILLIFISFQNGLI